MAAARRRVSESKRSADMKALERAAEAHLVRGFRRKLQAVSGTRPAIIAELKKASPSKGLIRDPLHVGALAAELARNGAAALSVLTEEERFLGSLANLCEASAATELPCLRKDFIVDEFQLLEARANRADAVLLIVAGLEQRELVFLNSRARALGLDVLCEVHDSGELKRAVDAGFEIIGVNTRDLRTFSVDPRRAFELAPMFPTSVVRVAESGITNGEDVAALRAAGYEAFLIGESLMRAEFPGVALKELLQEATAATSKQVAPS